MELLRQSFTPGRCILDLEASTLEEAIEATTAELVRRGQLAESQREHITESLLAREKVAATTIGQSVAVPHTYHHVLRKPSVVFVRLSRPINAGSMDGVAVSYLFLLIGPETAATSHVDTLAAIARFMSDSESRYELRHAEGPDELREVFDRFQQRTAPRPRDVGRERDEGVRRTGRFAGGLIADLRRRIPLYVSDITAGLHPKTVASSMFLFFACLAPTVTFGGVIGVSTEGQIGAVETIIATAIGGVLYAVLAGQPLNILGTTGPLLVFITTLFQLCQRMGIPFLPTYAWVSLWTAALVMVCAVTDASFLMRYFTRFTDEIFAALISMIFIYEAVSALMRESRGLSDSPDPSSQLLTLLLALGTLYLAMNLQAVRRSRFLTPWMREFLADFGPTIALVATSAIAFWLTNIDLTGLQIPDSFSTTSERSWFVNPLQAPTWVWWASAVPGLLGATLVFLDQNITGRLVNSSDHKLQKGPAYHWDLAVVALLTGVFSLFGLPWLVAATVRSLNHVRSLADVEERVTREGRRHDQIIHVRETRLTGLAIHLGIGLSLLALPLLKLVPMAVLYGMFLFMGLVSVRGNQFFERLMLFPTDSALYPRTHYISRVPIGVIHAYTGIQLACLSLLWVIKSSAIAILFPLFIAVLVPIRQWLGRRIEPEHLAALDAEEARDEAGLPG